MKKTLLIINGLLFSLISFSQQQIGNSNFESWEASSPETHEPINWNSFMTASGTWNTFAGQQMDWSTSVRPGSTGTKSVLIWSNSVLGTIANGNLTLGQINMGSTSPANSSNYNYSKTTDVNFSEPLTDTPDSIVFWVKFTPISGGSQARASIVLHNNYNFKDPNEVNDGIHCVATAILNYGTTSGAWVRKAIPFTYTGIAATNTHILATFTTNMTPGGGSDNDQVWIDDIELIYNPVNQPVVANDDAVSTFQDVAVGVSVLLNDTDPENDLNLSSLVILTPPTNGNVSIDNVTGIITYTPNAGWFGIDSYAYTICDNGIPILCDNATVTVTVTEVIVGNNQIIANDDVESTWIDNVVVTNVVANDVDVENQIDLTSLTVTVAPTNGTTSVNNATGEITYTPNASYFGLDSYTYSICDAGTPAITCDEAVVSMTVNINFGIEDVSLTSFKAFVSDQQLYITSNSELVGNYKIYATNGQLIQTGQIQNKVTFNNPTGIYFIHIQTSKGNFIQKISNL